MGEAEADGDSPESDAIKEDRHRVEARLGDGGDDEVNETMTKGRLERLLARPVGEVEGERRDADEEADDPEEE